MDPVNRVSGFMDGRRDGLTRCMRVVNALIAALATPAIAQNTLDRIRERGYITLGYIDGAAPFSFTGDDQQPQGYSPDVCKEVALGIRAQLKLPTLETSDLETIARMANDADEAVARWSEIALRNIRLAGTSLH